MAGEMQKGPRQPRRWLRDSLYVMAAYAAVGVLASVLGQGSVHALIWLAFGVALGLALDRGYHVVPAVFVSATALYLILEGASTPDRWIAGAGDGLLDALAVVTSCFTIRYRTLGKRFFDTAIGCARFAFYGGLVGPLTASLVVILILGIPSDVHFTSVPWALVNETLQHGLGSIAVAPAILAWLRDERWPSGRSLEFAAFVVVLVFGVLYMLEVFPERILIDIHLFAVTPLLIWPAFRLGRFPTFVSISLTALITTAASALGRGQFALQSHLGLEGAPAPMALQQSLLEVHLFLFIVGATLMIVLGVLSERKSAEEALLDEHAQLDERLRFVTLLSEVSIPFVHVPVEKISEEIERALERVARFFQAEVCSIFEFDDARKKLVRVHSFKSPDYTSELLETISPVRLPWAFQKMREGELLALEDLNQLPTDAGSERSLLEGRSVKSVACLPLALGGSSFGSVVLGWTAAQQRFSENASQRLELLGTILSNALLRQRAHRKLVQSSALNAGILDALTDQVAVINTEGVIMAVNRAWREYGRAHGADETTRRGVGLSYFSVCRESAQRGCDEARQALDTLISVMSGRQNAASLEYASPGLDEDRRFLMSVTALRSPEEGAVILHADTTERRRVEEELRQRQEQLSHIARLSAMGELAGALAHELNQPLTAIAANCTALENFAKREQLSAEELREALEDIGADARRAGNMVLRLRDFIRRGKTTIELLDFNTVISEFEVFLRTDAERMGARLILELAADLPPILGDRVHLELVLLNLLRNGLDAAKELPHEDRVVRLQSYRTENREVVVSLWNAGRPVPEDVFDRMFDPFFSTKVDGMGIGLSLSRSIVEAHGGGLRATRNLGGGLTMHVSIPAEIPVENGELTFGASDA